MHWEKEVSSCCEIPVFVIYESVLAFFSRNNGTFEFKRDLNVESLGLLLSCLLAGHYVYIESSAPRVQGDKARIISKTYPAADNMCLTFWYHMYGTFIGSLDVYASSYGNLGTAIWKEYGNKGNMWKMAQATVQTTSPFQVQV